MIKKTITIQNKLGLHARSASAFVKTVSSFGSSVSVTNKHATANGKSIMSMMMLQAGLGTDIDLTIEGEDEEDTLSAIITLINNKFGEEE